MTKISLKTDFNQVEIRPRTGLEHFKYGKDEETIAIPRILKDH